MTSAAALGLTEADFDDEPPFLIWPDNAQALKVFIAMGTQWTEMGLVYASLPEVWRRTKTPIGDRDRVFSDIRVMEAEVLKFNAEQAEKARRQAGKG